jgi:hypothetical protein
VPARGHRARPMTARHRRVTPWGVRLRRRAALNWRDLVVVAVYTGIAVFAYWGVWTAHGAATAAPGASDPALNIWYLTYTPFALLHGHSPLFSAWANAPYGVNLVSNTGEQAPALLAAPVTLLFGPATAYLALLTFAFASSATAAYALLRRWTDWRGAAFVGGILYGFSPYMVGQGEAHLNLVLVPLPPLIILVFDQLLVRRRGRPEMLGLALALLVVVQFFISAEVLTTTAVVCLIGLVAAAVLAPGRVRALVGPLVRCGVVAVAASLAVLAYPAWFAVHGPGHIVGPIQPLAEQYRADLAATVVPSPLQAIAPAAAKRVSAAFVDGDRPENGAYLGIPLLLVLLGTAVLLWRRRFVVRWAAIEFLACVVLALGARLTVAGTPSIDPARGLVLPEAVFGHLAVLSNLLPIRFTLYVGLFAGVLLAVATDELWALTGRRGAGWTPRAASALVVPVLALVPLIPPWPYAAATVPTPSYFTTSAVDAVPPGATVLLYPYPGYGIDGAAPMIWQADSFMRFKIAGGYFLLPQRDGRVGIGRATLVSGVLDDVDRGTPVARSAALAGALRAQLRSWHVRVILADPQGAAGRRGVSFLTWLLGRPPTVAAGVAAWYGTRFSR